VTQQQLVAVEGGEERGERGERGISGEGVREGAKFHC